MTVKEVRLTLDRIVSTSTITNIGEQRYAGYARIRNSTGEKYNIKLIIQSEVGGWVGYSDDDRSLANVDFDAKLVCEETNAKFSVIAYAGKSGIPLILIASDWANDLVDGHLKYRSNLAVYEKKNPTKRAKFRVFANSSSQASEKAADLIRVWMFENGLKVDEIAVEDE